MSHETFGPEVTEVMKQELARSMGAESIEYVGYDDTGDPIYAFIQREPDRAPPSGD